jgi:hypothetical protein
VQRDLAIIAQYADDSVERNVCHEPCQQIGARWQSFSSLSERWSAQPPPALVQRRTTLTSGLHSGRVVTSARRKIDRRVRSLGRIFIEDGWLQTKKRQADQMVVHFYPQAKGLLARPAAHS